MNDTISLDSTGAYAPNPGNPFGGYGVGQLTPTGLLPFTQVASGNGAPTYTPLVTAAVYKDVDSGEV